MNNQQGIRFHGKNMKQLGRTKDSGKKKMKKNEKYNKLRVWLKTVSNIKNWIPFSLAAHLIGPYIEID